MRPASVTQFGHERTPVNAKLPGTLGWPLLSAPHHHFVVTMQRRNLLLLFSHLAALRAMASTPNADVEESAVYEGYINSLPSSFPKDRALVIDPYSLVLRKRFQAWATPDDALRNVSTLDRVVASNLMAVCNDKVLVSLRAAKLNERPKVFLPSVAELSTVLGDGDQAAWDRFAKSYPRSIGLTQFSRVGFNKARDEAAMFVHTKGGIDDGTGTGEIAMMRKSDGTWSTHSWKGLWLD